jgi:Uma2 family endonuclease
MTGNVTTVRLPTPRVGSESDQRVVLTGVTWEQYEAIGEAVGDRPGLKLTYLDGTLEIMTKSPGHETDTKLIARLVEVYAEERAIRFAGFRETTWKKKARKAGLEADECYFVGELREFPHLAVEVVKTSGGVDKLEVYRRLGVDEVWFWIEGRIHDFRLGQKGYAPAKRSGLLPELDLERLAAIVRSTPPMDQTDAVRKFRRSLGRGRPKK